jgi:hypothetical protein
MTRCLSPGGGPPPPPLLPTVSPTHVPTVHSRSPTCGRWVACTPARYAATLIAVAGAALGVSLVKALRTRAEQRLGGARSAPRGLLDDEGGDAMQLGAARGEGSPGSPGAGAPAAGAGRLLVCRATLRDNVVRAGFVGASRAAIPVLIGHAAFLAPY